MAQRAKGLAAMADSVSARRTTNAVRARFTDPDAPRAEANWRHRAACREQDPELFFPVGNTGPALLQIHDAKTVCRPCPVAEQCLRWALESGQHAGVWGGTSEDERRALRRRAIRERARK